MEYTKALGDLIEEFRKFPSIGPKSAQRMAFSLLKKNHEQTEKLINAIKNAKSNIQYCEQCFNLTSKTNSSENCLCEICKNPRRNANMICVVEEVKDLIAIERTREYSGHYHVLGGVISPLDGIGADDINIAPLLERVRKKLASGEDLELILALGLSTEGEATILYLCRRVEKILLEIKSYSIKITRLAYGLPVGADLDYTDEGTLAKAISARVAV